MHPGRLISIDDMHCTTRYNLKLATLMLVDDHGRWVPAGFLFASRMDKEEAKSRLLTQLSQYRTEHRGCFDDYFRRYYLTRQEHWAPYKRTAAIANTTMVSERADELVHILISALLDIAREHLIQDERGMTEGKFRTRENMSRHKRTVEKGKTAGMINTRGTMEWKVESFTTPGRYNKLNATSCHCENVCFHKAWPSGENTVPQIDSEEMGIQAIATTSNCTELEDMPEVNGAVGLGDKRRELITELQEYVDRLSFSWNTRTTVDEDRLASLSRTRDLMRQAVEEELGEFYLMGSQEAALVPRGSQEAALTPRSACRNRSRAVQIKQSRVKKMAKRTLREPTQGAENFHTRDIDADELNICILCEDTQPPLDDPLMKTLWEERLYFGGAVRAVKYGHTGTACDIEIALCAMEYLSPRASLLGFVHNYVIKLLFSDITSIAIISMPFVYV
ncbi:unnamed protein product [Strongylus vulgaris]|uniref:MULE transposase domain-containing protein n=1 Tax=Strongylus vulgaris TaxID=40348 RepID=A0A3P7LFV0_STRVU|nr:unnamed protein product [Strongylus vulgaris]